MSNIVGFSHEFRGRPKAMSKTARRCALLGKEATASGDPAMAFKVLPRDRALRALRFRPSATATRSTPNPQPFDQGPVPGFVGALEVVEQLAPLRDQLQQAAA